MPSGLDLRETASPGEKSSLGQDPLGLSKRLCLPSFGL